MAESGTKGGREYSGKVERKREAECEEEEDRGEKCKE